MSEKEETIEIYFDTTTGILTYKGPKEDGEELLQMLEDAGVGFLIYRRSTTEDDT